MKLNNYTTYEAFKTYILEQLGQGAVNIEVTDDQILNRISDAIMLFSERHFDGTVEDILLLTFDQNEREYDLTGKIGDKVVLSVLNELKSSTLSDWFLRNSLHFKESPIILYNNWNDFDRLFQTSQFIDLIKDSFLATNTFSFNFTNQKLTLLNNPVNDWDNTLRQTRAFTVFTVNGFSRNDDGDLIINDNIYNNRWFRKYCTAQVKFQWGTNLMKYGNVQLPGGQTLQAETIRTEAKEEIDKLEEELRKEYTFPPRFFFG